MPRGLPHLRSVVDRLLSRQGCPWDRQQTHRSLVRYLREEALELEKAIDAGRWHEIEDELGDLLFHIFFHSKIAKKAGLFDIDTVAESQALKLERRHPHVFGRSRVFKDAAEVARNWKTIKAAERAQRRKDVVRRMKSRRNRKEA